MSNIPMYSHYLYTVHFYLDLAHRATLITQSHSVEHFIVGTSQEQLNVNMQQAK